MLIYFMGLFKLVGYRGNTGLPEVSNKNSMAKIITLPRCVAMTLIKKLVLILSAVAIGPVIIIGILGYSSAKTELQNLRMEELKSLSNIKAKVIKDFFTQQLTIGHTV